MNYSNKKIGDDDTDDQLVTFYHFFLGMLYIYTINKMQQVGLHG